MATLCSSNSLLFTKVATNLSTRNVVFFKLDGKLLQHNNGLTTTICFANKFRNEAVLKVLTAFAFIFFYDKPAKTASQSTFHMRSNSKCNMMRTSSGQWSIRYEKIRSWIGTLDSDSSFVNVLIDSLIDNNGSSWLPPLGGSIAIYRPETKMCCYLISLHYTFFFIQPHFGGWLKWRKYFKFSNGFKFKSSLRIVFV